MRISRLLADSSHHDNSKPPAQTGAQSIDDRLPQRCELAAVDFLLHEKRTAHDSTVDSDQRQEDTQLAIQCRRELLDSHLHQLHERCDGGDEDDEREEIETDIGQTGPSQCALFQNIFIQKVVQRHGHRHHERDGGAEAESRLDALRHGDVRAHAEEEGEHHVVDKNRPDKNIQ